MTDTHIDKLIEAVQAGDAALTSRKHFSALPEGDRLNSNPHLACKAYRGSLDAAAALHDVLLPGWEYWVSSKHYWDGEEGPIAFLRAGTSGVDLKVVQAKSTDLARAWLLAVLKAYRAQVAVG